MTEKTEVKDGKRKTIKTEEVLKSDGTKEITQTVTEGTDVKSSKFCLAPGQERPKELLN